MGFSEVLQHARSLSQAEQIRLVEVLVEENRQSEKNLFADLPEGATIPIWSPYDAYEAARVMLDLLNKTETKS